MRDRRRVSTTFSSTPTSVAASSWRALPRSASWLVRAFSAAFACPLSSQRAPAAASLDRRSCSAASRTRACFSRCASASFPRSSSLSTHAGSCASVYCRCMSSANTCQQSAYVHIHNLTFALDARGQLCQRVLQEHQYSKSIGSSSAYTCSSIVSQTLPAGGDTLAGLLVLQCPPASSACVWFVSTDSVLVSHLKCTTVNLHTSCQLKHYVSSASVSHLHMWF